MSFYPKGSVNHDFPLYSHYTVENEMPAATRPMQIRCSDQNEGQKLPEPTQPSIAPNHSSDHI